MAEFDFTHTGKRPDCERAHAFTAGLCGDPNCGLHIIGLRVNDQPICEIVIGSDALHGLLAYIHDNGLDLR
jgi:hypothetical protein